MNVRKMLNFATNVVCRKVTVAEVMTVCASTTLTAGASRAQSTAEIDLPAPDSAPSKIGRLPPRKLLAPPQGTLAHQRMVSDLLDTS